MRFKKINFNNLKFWQKETGEAERNQRVEALRRKVEAHFPMMVISDKESAYKIAKSLGMNIDEIWALYPESIKEECLALHGRKVIYKK